MSSHAARRRLFCRCAAEISVAAFFSDCALSRSAFRAAASFLKNCSRCVRAAEYADCESFNSPAPGTIGATPLGVARKTSIALA